MFKIANAQFWVHDQDKALGFYPRPWAWEVRADVSVEHRTSAGCPWGRLGRTRSAWSSFRSRDRRCSTKPAALNWPSWWRRIRAAPCSGDRRLPGRVRRTLGQGG